MLGRHSACEHCSIVISLRGDSSGGDARQNVAGSTEFTSHREAYQKASLELSKTHSSEADERQDMLEDMSALKVKLKPDSVIGVYISVRPNYFLPRTPNELPYHFSFISTNYL